MMNRTLPVFRSRIVPVVVVTDPLKAVPMAEALLAGGIDVMEITLRHSAALAGIEAVARAVPDMCVGAGTVTRAADVQRVMDAGAGFALSPGMSATLLDTVNRLGLPFVPGVMTPGEVMTAREAGFQLLKLFPAAQAGGVGMLKALGGPLADVRFCPTGGIGPDNLLDYLRQPNVAMVGGSWLTPADAVSRGEWTTITRLAQEAATIASQA